MSASARIWAAHTTLAVAIDDAFAAFASAPLSSAIPLEWAATARLAAHSAIVMGALAELLDELDRILANEGAMIIAREPIDDLAAVLHAIEPPPAAPTAEDDFHPGVARRASPIGRLPALYAALVGRANRLERAHVVDSADARDLLALWQTLTYDGVAIAGLLARLDHIATIDPAQPRTAPRGHRSTVAVTTGERVVLTIGGSPPAPSYPWDRRDIATLRRLAHAAGLLATPPPTAEQLQVRTAASAAGQLSSATCVDLICGGALDRPAPPTISIVGGELAIAATRERPGELVVFGMDLVPEPYQPLGFEITLHGALVFTGVTAHHVRHARSLGMYNATAIERSFFERAHGHALGTAPLIALVHEAARDERDSLSFVAATSVRRVEFDAARARALLDAIRSLHANHRVRALRSEADGDQRAVHATLDDGSERVLGTFHATATAQLELMLAALAAVIDDDDDEPPRGSMLAKYSPHRDTVRELAAASVSRERVTAMLASVLERGGVVGCPISNERWLFLSGEPPADRVGIAAEHLSPAWEAMVVDEAKNWYVVFFIADRAVAASLGEALITGGDVDAILDRRPGIASVDSGPWR